MWHYKKLDVWRKARLLAREVYRTSDGWPRSELYGLTTQVRRAAVSVGANIAEGSGRSSPGEYAQFLGYAMGSLNEVEHHLIIARDLGFPVEAGVTDVMSDVGRMLHRLRTATLDRAAKPNRQR